MYLTISPITIYFVEKIILLVVKFEVIAISQINFVYFNQVVTERGDDGSWS